MQPDKRLSHTEVKVFNREEFGDLRVVQMDGEPWFVAKDVCNALEIGRQQDSTRYLDDDEKRECLVDTPGGRQKMACVSEPGLYRLVMKSRTPLAKRFQRWVTHEVLPAIRRDGGYVAAVPGEGPEELMARALKVADATLRRQAAQIEEMRPKALFADAVSASDRSILVGDLAKILRQNGVDTGRQRLFARLHEDGFLMWSRGAHMPTQRAMEMGLFEVKEHTGLKPDGSAWTSMTVCVTGRGQVYFVNRYCKGAA